MTSWAQPLNEGIFQLGCSLGQRQRESWLDRDAAMRAAPNGDAEKTTIHLIIDHISLRFRKLAPPSEPLLLLLDGHSSRKGLLWLMKAVERRIEAAKAPASASHFLQPCDETINKKLKTRARKTRGISLQRSTAAGAGAPQLKLICASHALRWMPPGDATAAFEATGIWPMNMQLLRGFCAPRKRIADEAVAEKENLERRPKSAKPRETKGLPSHREGERNSCR